MIRRLLIADATPTNRIALKSSLGSARYDVMAVSSGAAALRAVERTRARDATEPAFDLVLADASLPDLSGAQLCGALGAGRDGVPPVLLLGDSPDEVTRLAALRAGAEDLLLRPISRSRLLAHVRNLLRAQAARAELSRRDATAMQLGFAEAPQTFVAPGRAVLVAADARAPVMSQSLRAHLRHRLQVLQPSEALALGDLATEAQAPDVLVVPVFEMDGEDGMSLISELRSRPATRRTAILALYDGARASDASVQALDLGADDLADCGANSEEIALRIGRLIARKRNSDRLRRTVDAGLQLAAIDPLTTLFNRRYAMHQIADLARQPHSATRALGVMILDIDHFKRVNDTYGHAAGDAALVEVAHRLRDNLRGADLVARLGGEEFVVVLPHTDPQEALGAAERLRGLVAARPARLPDGSSLDLTISIGLALGTGSEESADRLLERADRALYAAKDGGRNRVVVAGEPGLRDSGEPGMRPVGSVTWGEHSAPCLNGPVERGPGGSARFTGMDRPVMPFRSR